MRMDTTLSTRLSQVQILAPRMIQSMEILQLPIMALQERIQQELQENPVLELKEANKDDTLPEENLNDFSGDGQKDPNDPRTELVIDANGNGEEDFDRLEKINQDWADHFNEEHARVSSNRVDEEGDRRHDFEQNMPSRPQSLQDYLTEQLSFLDYAPDVERLMRHIISNVADTGWLGRLHENTHFTPITLDEMTASYDLPTTVEQVEKAVKCVQKLDPPGVAARDMVECLLLQV